MSTIKVDTIQTRAGASEISITTLKADTIQNTSGTSEIGIDALKGASSAGSMTVVGEGGSTTTNLQQGLAKFWCHTTTSTSVDSLNQASITDVGTGNYTHNFTNNMNNDAYAGGTVGTSGDHLSSGTHSTSAVNFQHFNQSNSSVDCDTDQTVHGDLA